MSYHEILEALRKRRIPHPTNRSFSVAKWREGFSQFDSLDIALLEKFGEDLYGEMCSVREQLAQVEAEFPVDAQRAHLCLAQANLAVLQVEQLQQVEDSGDVFPDFVAAEELKGVEMNLRPTMTSYVEAVFDAIRLPLAYFAGDAKDDSGRRLKRIAFYPKLAAKANQLAGIYGAYEYLWGLAVWRGSHISLERDDYHLSPKNWNTELRLAEAQHLNEAEKAQIGMRLYTQWQRLSLFERSSLTPPIARLRVDGLRLKISWNWKARDLEVPGIDFLGYQMIENRGLRGVLQVAQCAPGLSAFEAMKFRAVLREIGLSFSEKLIQAERSIQVDLISASMDKGELCRACREVLHWPVEKIVKCIDLFTFRNARSEVWFQPLVELGKNAIGFALHPLCYASSVRTAEWLVSQDSTKEGEKGYEFEMEIAASFEEAASRNEVVDICIRKGLKTSNEIGDIDILVLFGSLVLAIECKCAVFPSSVDDFHNRENVIESASRQAKRKAAYITKNWASFAVKAKLKAKQSPRAFIPLVLVSGIEYVGVRLYDEVSVVSRDSLIGVISNFATSISLLKGEEEKYIKAPERRFATPIDAEREVLNEIASPSILDFYVPYVTEQVAKYLSVTKSRFRYFSKYADVAFDEEGKVRYLNSIGVSAIADGLSFRDLGS